MRGFIDPDEAVAKVAADVREEIAAGLPYENAISRIATRHGLTTEKVRFAVDTHATTASEDDVFASAKA